MPQVNEQKDEEEEIKPEETIPEAFILLGSTGLGKSTYVVINCPDVNPILMGHGVRSETKGFKIYGSNNMIYVDTMGTDDYEGIKNDADILRQIMYCLKKISPQGIKIKIIWFIAPSDRCENSLKIQAEFIGSLSKYSNKNAWKSTLINVKEGELKPKSKAYGALHAASIHGAPTINNLTDSQGNKLAQVDTIGYTDMSVLSDDDAHMENIRDGIYTTQFRIGLGLLSRDEIKEQMTEKLNQLPFFTIKFTPKTCKKCGVKGDPRFVPLLCHLGEVPKEIHPNQNLSKIHTGSLAYRHPGATSYKHTGSIERYHSSSTYNKTIGSTRVKNGTTTKCGYGHTNVFFDITVTKGTFYCKYNGHSMGVGTSLWSCGTCNNQNLYNNFGYTKNGKSGTWKATMWCENHLIKSDKYKSEDITDTVYRCCNWSSGSTGCKSRNTCCRRDVGSQGCTLYYTCCGSTSSNGCEQYYTCCSTKASNNRPCSFSCCRRNIYTGSPCKKVCPACGKEWGNTKGCGTENRKHLYDE